MRNKLLFLLLTSFVMIGCNDDELSVVVDDTSKASNETRAIVSGMIGTESTTNPILYDDWENVTEIMLNNGRPVTPPWIIEEGQSINIPNGIRTDVKKSDGWTMLGHTLRKVEEEPSYILFYHKKSGILKVFFHSSVQFSPNENFTWVVESDKPTSMIPSGLKESHLSNVSHQFMLTPNILKTSVTSSSGALRYGWNCFTFEFQYGPNNNNPLITIDGYNNFISKLDINGTFAGQVIVPDVVTYNQWKDLQWYFQTTSNLTGSIGQFNNSLVANRNATSPQEINGTQTRSALGIIGIIAAATSAISNIIGTASHFTSKNEVIIHRYNLGGNIELTGTMMSGPLPAIPTLGEFDIMKLNNNEALGVWGLKSSPVVRFDKYRRAYQESYPDLPEPLEPLEPLDNINTISSYSASINIVPQINKEDVIINPALLSDIKDYTVSVKSIFASKNMENRIRSSSFNFDSYYQSLSDGWQVVDLNSGELTLKKRVRDNDYTLPIGFTTKRYWFEFTMPKEVYVSVNLEIEYNDGSFHSSGRLFLVNIQMNDNKHIMTYNPKALDIIFK